MKIPKSELDHIKQEKQETTSSINHETNPGASIPKDRSTFKMASESFFKPLFFNKYLNPMHHLMCDSNYRPPKKRIV